MRKVFMCLGWKEKRKLSYCVTGQYCMSCEVNTLDFLESRDKVEEAEEIGIRAGLFLCRHTPPRAHKKPVMFAHSFIWSYSLNIKYNSFTQFSTFFIRNKYLKMKRKWNLLQARGRTNDEMPVAFLDDEIRSFLDFLLQVRFAYLWGTVKSAWCWIPSS